MRICRLPFKDEPLLGLLIRDAGQGQLCPDVKPEQHDSLTGLPDRAFLFERLTSLMASERSHDRRFAVLFIDFDNFKQVNDAHGHLVGDRVLSALATRLSQCVRDSDCVVRFGGDEFVVLVEDVTTPSEIDRLVARIQAVLQQGIALPEGDFRLSASIGTALATPQHQTPEDLLNAADRAMYAAKRLNQ